MAYIPYIDGNEDRLLGILKMYSRMGQYPLDPTSVFNTKEELLEYINESGSYAYPGQVVAVANGNIADGTQDDDYSLYVIRSNRTIQEIGKNLTFSSMDDALVFIENNKSNIEAGQLVTIADDENGYSLHMVREDHSLHRLSYEATDTPDVSWANLQGKPISSPDSIDTAVDAAHTHGNQLILDKISVTEDNKIAYENTPLATVSDISWENMQDKPTDLGSLGITDVYTTTQIDSNFVKNTEVTDIPEANKILRLDDNAQIPAYILSGVIPLANLPHGAVERCIVVDTDEDRFALTTENIQTGDTVKVNSTGKMYFVVDDTNLGSEDGYTIYTAGAASTVEWAGILNKPTNIAGYGITDAISTEDVVDTAEAEKILRLNAEGKLPADITGDAATVGGKSASDFISNADVVITAEANKLLKLNDEAKLPADITGDAATVGGKSASDFVAATDVVDTAEANKLLKLDADGKLPADITGAAGSVQWSGVQNKPNTLAGYGITDAIANTDIVSVAEPNKVLKLNENGELPANITGNAATATSVEWVGVQNKPTTLAGYGITDGYTQDEITDNFVSKSELSTVAEANKVLKLNEQAKLPADITGNAATATNVEWSGVLNTPSTLAEYGITDVYNKTQSDEKYVPVTDVVETPAANKLLKLDAEGKLPADVLSGIIPIQNLPHGALERCVVVASDTARFSLTNLNVQTGDTVKVESTGKMYFVVDETKLGSEAGYEIYTAGSATSVPWAGITDTPNTVSGYGITDVYTKEESNTTFVPVSDIVTAPEAEKILRLDADGKLPADITGAAGSVAWANITGKPETLESLGITDVYNKEYIDGNFVNVTDVVTTATANKLLKLDADGKLPADITGAAGSVAWANITGKPSSEASEIDDAVTKRHDHANKATIDMINVDDSGKMMFGENNTVAYMTDITSMISVGNEDPTAMPVGGLWLDTTVAEVTE